MYIPSPPSIMKNYVIQKKIFERTITGLVSINDMTGGMTPAGAAPYLSVQDIFSWVFKMLKVHLKIEVGSK